MTDGRLRIALRIPHFRFDWAWKLKDRPVTGTLEVDTGLWSAKARNDVSTTSVKVHSGDIFNGEWSNLDIFGSMAL